MARTAKKRSPCAEQPAPWDEDKCRGCDSFLDCAKQSEDFDAECICWNCFWTGYWDDANERVIRATRQDPEERYRTCSRCGEDVESCDD